MLSFFGIKTMKKTLFSIPLILMCSVSYSATINNHSSPQILLGYSYGYIMGRNNAEVLKDKNLDVFIQGLKQNSAEQKTNVENAEFLKDINLDAFIQGIRQGSTGKASDLTDEEMAKALLQYKKHIDAQLFNDFKKLALDNAKVGQAFLDGNAKKTDIKTTRSGLQYQVIQSGEGKKPSVKSKVLLNYEGRLLDGTVFDSSIARDQPVEFQVNQVIPGWTEGLQLMPEGSKYRLYIPSKLAYGEMGSGDAIGPNSTLIFDIELLNILP